MTVIPQFLINRMKPPQRKSIRVDWESVCNRTSYLNYGFVLFSKSKDLPQPQCVVCSKVLSTSVWDLLNWSDICIQMKQTSWTVWCRVQTQTALSSMNESMEFMEIPCTFRNPWHVWTNKCLSRRERTGFSHHQTPCYSAPLKDVREIWLLFFCTEDQAASYLCLKNPFTENIEEKLLEELIDLSSDSTLKACFREIPLETFWCESAAEYTVCHEAAMKALLQLCSTDLCEAGFSAMTAIKTQHRSRLTLGFVRHPSTHWPHHLQATAAGFSLNSQ